MAEQDEQDTLWVVLQEISDAAADIRGLRDSTTRDLQRIISDDVLGALYAMGEDLSERDFDHDARLQRVERALGLAPITDSEIEAILEGGDVEGSEDDEDEDEEDEDGDEEAASPLDSIPPEVLREALGSIKKLAEVVAENRTPSEEEQKAAAEVLTLLAFLAPILDGATPEDAEATSESDAVEIEVESVQDDVADESEGA